jgi:NhaA family Na+:H+ antiporter
MMVVKNFLKSEAAGGIVLMAAAVAALIVANSTLYPWYSNLLYAPTGPVLSEKLGPMNMHLWINDGLMAIFFLLVGLEIKREFVDGRLVSWDQRRLPFIAAAGGMAAPALVYLAITQSSPDLASGWAIPAATDIAFAIGVMALLGKRVPTALKLFLTTVAIIDDMGAVIIIAVAYTASIKGLSLLAAAAILGGMFFLNRSGVRHLGIYLIGFAMLWYAVLLSGVHATVAGVLAAFAVPVIKTPGAVDSPDSPLHKLEHALHPWVAFAIVPIFGFANAGISLDGVSTNVLFTALPLGIAAGLVLGKQSGIFGLIWISVKLGIANKPRGTTWLQIYGMAALCGIGFTMSLFIGMLAFADSAQLVEDAKIGILTGSIVSGVIGYLVLRFAPSAVDQDTMEQQIDDEIKMDGDANVIERSTRS